MATNGNAGNKIMPEQQRAIDALLDTKDLAASAQRAGVDPEELLQWMARDNAFNEVLSCAAHSRRDEDFQEIMAELEWEWTITQ